jgi:hypothetical protein
MALWLYFPTALKLIGVCFIWCTIVYMIVWCFHFPHFSAFRTLNLVLLVYCFTCIHVYVLFAFFWLHLYNPITSSQFHERLNFDSSIQHIKRVFISHGQYSLHTYCLDVHSNFMLSSFWDIFSSVIRPFYHQWISDSMFMMCKHSFCLCS